MRFEAKLKQGGWRIKQRVPTGASHEFTHSLNFGLRGRIFGCIDFDSRQLLIDCTYQTQTAQGLSASHRRVILSLFLLHRHSAPLPLFGKWPLFRIWTLLSPNSLPFSISSRPRLIPPWPLSLKLHASDSVTSRSLAVLCFRRRVPEVKTKRGSVCYSKRPRYVDRRTIGC